ncbi:flavin reductase family protein [Nonomuraea sp. B12E4]|uniref:flavin reductase family protein n=1 Tax=Nonomuraea sp. B12E4 TaxID=3153564 RepID=UPI00325F924F
MKVHDSPLSLGLTDAMTLRRAFGTFATGVTVITTGEPNPHAMTANSFTSVSLDPPLLLVCVDRSALMHRYLSEGSFFGVSVLAADQETAARHFANRLRTLGAAQFDQVDWRPGDLTGVPLLSGTLAEFECEMWRSYDGGDHSIFVGRVLSVERPTDLDPLLVAQGRFRTITPDWYEVPS